MIVLRRKQEFASNFRRRKSLDLAGCGGPDSLEQQTDLLLHAGEASNKSDKLE